MEDHDTKLALLQASLSVAVLIEVDRLRQLSWEQVAALVRKATDVIASKGDIILYKSRKPGETAAAFASLARAVAVASFVPGGIRIFDLKFESWHMGEPPRGTT